MSLKRVMGFVTAVSMIAPYAAFAGEPPPAQADANAQDVLFKNGAKARGQVIDIMPGDHVTLRLRNGEARRFDWKDVDRVVPASGPEPPPLPPLTPPPTATVAPTAAPTTAPTVVVAPPQNVLPPATGPTVRVHINASVPTQFYRKAASMTSSVKVCDAPCDMEFPISDEYQIAPSGGKTTTVHLQGQQGQTNVFEVSPPSDFGKIGGVLMIVAGAIGFLVGASVDFVGFIAENVATTTSDHSSADSILIVGLVITGVSIGLGVGGIIVFVKSGDTDVSQKMGQLKMQLPENQDDRFVRTPTWHTITPFEPSARGPTATIPLFSRSF